MLKPSKVNIDDKNLIFEAVWQNLMPGYYLIRGIFKSDRALCKGRITLKSSEQEVSSTLPIPRSGRINHIIKISPPGVDLLILQILITLNTVIHKEISLKKLNSLERLGHFYRRILGVYFSKNPITVELRNSLKMCLFETILRPEMAYYKISELRYKRLCEAKSYEEWLEEYRKDELFFWQNKEKIKILSKGPKILVVVVSKGNGDNLKRSMESIKNQICAPERVYVCSSKGIERILKDASEDYVLFLEEGDALSPSAICCFKYFAYNQGYPEIIYADNDYLGERGIPKDPQFKPDWSLDYFFEHDYIHSPVIFKMGILTSLELEEFGSNYEIILQLLKEKEDIRIDHIPALLLTQEGLNNRYLNKLEKLKEFLKERAEVFSAKEPYTFKVVYKVDTLPKVSIIIPTKDKPKLIKNCIRTLLDKTNYPNYEIVIVDNGSKEKEVLDFYKELELDKRIKIFPYNIPFNFSKLVNFGVSKAEGSLICLLNNDMEIIEENWLAEMVRHALRKEVGVVGTKLLYPDGTIQHAGVIMGIWNGADHAFKGEKEEDGYMYRLSTTQNYLAVTGACMMFRKEIFDEVGGFDEEFSIDFNDVDFCLKVFENGYRILLTPYAVLIHLESKSKLEVKDEEIARKEIFLLREKWRKYIQRDPYYNPNLTIYDTNFELYPIPRFVIQ